MNTGIYYDQVYGWVHNLDPVLVSLGSLQIRYYGAVFALTLWIAFMFWDWQMRRGGYPKPLIDSIILYGVVGTVAGARLGHCLFYEWDIYGADPWRILKFWEGGLASHGATAGIILALMLYCWRHKLNFWEMADRFTFSAATGAAGVRLGNFLNSEIVGRETAWAGGMRFVRFDAFPGGEATNLAAIPVRHPSQLYEFALGVAVWLALWAADRALGKEKRPRAALFGLFLGLYFLGRFALEYFKEYQTDLRLSQGLTMGQYLSIIPCLLGWVIFAVALGRRKKAEGSADGQK